LPRLVCPFSLRCLVLCLFLVVTPVNFLKTRKLIGSLLSINNSCSTKVLLPGRRCRSSTKIRGVHSLRSNLPWRRRPANLVHNTTKGRIRKASLTIEPWCRLRCTLDTNLEIYVCRAFSRPRRSPSTLFCLCVRQAFLLHNPHNYGSIFLEELLLHFDCSSVGRVCISMLTENFLVSKFYSLTITENSLSIKEPCLSSSSCSPIRVFSLLFQIFYLVEDKGLLPCHTPLY